MVVRPALGFVFVTAALDSIGFGIILPVLPELIMEVSGEGLGSAARYGGWLLTMYAVTQFFCAPILGNLSDRFGRRPVLVGSLLAMGADYLLMSWAPTLGWLFLGRMISGATAATFSTCNAFIADITPPERRAQAFGIIGAAFGLGFVVGPVIGGVLGGYGVRVPFLGAAALTFLNLVYGLVALPETLPKDKRRPFAWRRANPLGTLAALRRHPVVLRLIGAHFIFMLGHQALPSTWSYFTMERFDWSERQVGYSLGFVGLLMVVMQAGVLRMVLARVGQRRAAALGFASATLAYVGYALSGTELLLYLCLVVGSLQGFVAPSVRSIMSAEVPESAQGELQGGIASVVSLTAILSPPLMTQAFATFSAPDASPYLPGAPYVLAAALTITSALLFLRATRPELESSPLER